MSNGYSSTNCTTTSTNGTSLVRLATLACLALVVSGALTACSRNYSRFMKLPVDPTLESGMGWVVIASAYAPLREKPDKFSPEISVLRGGSVFKPTARVIDGAGMDSGGLWYGYAEGPARGWIHSSNAISFPSEEQAKKYASESRDK